MFGFSTGCLVSCLVLRVSCICSVLVPVSCIMFGFSMDVWLVWMSGIMFGFSTGVLYHVWF